tara:strand:+ start:1630 stop:1818 length:189 start_codon:yes stop_codon:yes gene_type:complete
MTTDNKEILDLAAASTGVATYAQILPNIAAVFTIVWLGIRILESDTAQSIKDKVLKLCKSKD